MRGWRLAGPRGLRVAWRVRTQGDHRRAAPRTSLTGAARAKTQKQAPAPAGNAPTLLTFNWGSELDADVFAIREEFCVQGRFRAGLAPRSAVPSARAARRAIVTRSMFSGLQMKLDDKPVHGECGACDVRADHRPGAELRSRANGDFMRAARPRASEELQRARLPRGRTRSLPPDEALFRRRMPGGRR